MKYGDISAMIVGYNFVIGVLVMLSSEKVAYFAGLLFKPHQAIITRLTHISTKTSGACVAVISGLVYIVVHKLGVGV